MSPHPTTTTSLSDINTMLEESDRLNMQDLQEIIKLGQQQQQQQQSPPPAVTREGTSMMDLLRMASGQGEAPVTNDNDTPKKVNADSTGATTAFGFGSIATSPSPTVSAADGDKPKSPAAATTTTTTTPTTTGKAGDGSFTYTQAMKIFDPALKLKLMKRAADAGYPKACYEMGKMYENGVWGLDGDLLVQKNISLALAQYTKAGDNGDALYRLYSLQHSDPTSKEIHPTLYRSAAFGNLNASITLSQILLQKIPKLGLVMHNPALARYVSNLTGWLDRKVDREPKDAIVTKFFNGEQAQSLDLYFKMLVATQGHKIHKMAVDGNADALLELVVAFKWGMRDNYSIMALILASSLANLNRPEGFYEVGRYFQFDSETKESALHQVVAMYHHALLLCKNPETDTTTAILTLLALADIHNKGDPSNIFNPLVPKSENLATSYQTLAKELLLQEKSLPVSYLDIPHHLDGSLMSIYEGMAIRFIQGTQKHIKDGLKENIGSTIEAITTFIEQNGGLGRAQRGAAGGNRKVALSTQGAGRVNNVASQEATG
ncbi:hypothetical protein HDU76_013386, partial [Blyttiomyces sp. JEL0837]